MQGLAGRAEQTKEEVYGHWHWPTQMSCPAQPPKQTTTVLTTSAKMFQMSAIAVWDMET